MWDVPEHPNAHPCVRWLFGGRADGDGAVRREPSQRLEVRRQLVDHPWTLLEQVHGADVFVIDDDEGTEAEADAAVTRCADAAVTRCADTVVSVTTADCAPVVLWGVAGGNRSGRVAGGDRPIVAACHAGWRGLSAGVIEATVAAMRELGASDVDAVLGPCVSPAVYEFGAAELTTLALQFGPDVVGATDDGRPAFDLRAGVRAACRNAGVTDGSIEWLSAHEPPCTATFHDDWFSWRARHESGRNLSAIWIDAVGVDR